MPKITYVQPNGERKTVDVPVGTSLMLGAIRGNVRGIEAECGGCLSCATCHVYVEDRFLEVVTPKSEAEAELLEGVATELKPTSRLSCQIDMTRALDGMIVTIPEEQ